MYVRITMLTVLLGLGMAGLLLAEEDNRPGELDQAEVTSVIEEEILVLATRLGYAMEDTGATVTVYTKEDFEARQTRQSGEALRPTPGAFLAGKSSSLLTPRAFCAAVPKREAMEETTW